MDPLKRAEQLHTQDIDLQSAHKTGSWGRHAVSGYFLPAVKTMKTLGAAPFNLMNRTARVLRGQLWNDTHYAIQSATKALREQVQSYDEDAREEHQEQLKKSFFDILQSDNMRKIFKVYDYRSNESIENSLIRDLVKLYCEICPSASRSLEDLEFSNTSHRLAILSGNELLSTSNCLKVLSEENYRVHTSVCLNEFGTPEKLEDSIKKLSELPEEHSCEVESLISAVFTERSEFEKHKIITNKNIAVSFQRWFDYLVASERNAEQLYSLASRYQYLVTMRDGGLSNPYATFLSNENFVKLAESDCDWLDSDTARYHVWNRIPIDSEHSEHIFSELLILAIEEPNLKEFTHRGKAIIDRYAQQYQLDIPPERNERLLIKFAPIENQQQAAREQLNDSQGIHKKSVEEGASESATMLETQYGSLLNSSITLDTVGLLPDLLNKSDAGKTLSEKFILSRFLHRLEKSSEHTPQTQAAKRFIKHTFRTTDFTDDRSQVTLKQLLALTIIGAHDQSKLVKETSVADSRIALIQGLYECQRGNNLSESGIDDDDIKDFMICKMGAFSKLINSMQGVHTCCEVIVTGNEVATLKFPRVVNDEIRKWLSTLPEEEQGNARVMLSKEGVNTDAWEAIESAVVARMNDEFGEFFKKSSEHSLEDFTEFVEFTRLDPDLTA
ncbi:hypothetical protein EOPP23_13785 [Endozoicomonas sp. OPT23]|uniref:hypothetical protein n=1 Tax=Endozoicomonas sp. OPT23 TaxID=2072845 RepID=UPI00129BBD37|nr:hypothetical protein [Endozoicomonas sp. OPT23]MRI34063.1 hypothetical protein [Endozoicomonas sp. OPT23]